MRENTPIRASKRSTAQPKEGSMKAKVLGFIVVVLALAAATAGTAGATAPAVTEVNVDRTIPVPAGGACSFPITIHNVGLRRTTTYFDANGNVTRTVIHLVGFTQSVTNDLTGATLLFKKLLPNFFGPTFGFSTARRIEQDRVNQVWGANQTLLIERNELQQRAIRC